MQMTKGKIITIEGSDGSGKQTQTSMLVKRAEKAGYNVATMSFPQYDKPTGKKITEYLGGKFGEPSRVDPIFASKLYAEDRRVVKEEVLNKINSGVNWILDRWIESNMGYQAAKVKEEDRIKIVDWIKQHEIEKNGLPESDFVIYLDLPVKFNQEAMEKQGRIKDGHEKNVEYLLKVESVYRWLASKNGNWKAIDCLKDSGPIKIRKTENEINDEIWESIKPILTK
jgi:dTMP kinase